MMAGEQFAGFIFAMIAVGAALLAATAAMIATNYVQFGAWHPYGTKRGR